MSSELKPLDPEPNKTHVRFPRLCEVMKRAIDLTVRRLMNFEEISACFPTLASLEEGQEVLDAALKLITDYFSETSLLQFTHICEHYNLKPKFDNLDEALYDAVERMRVQGPRIYPDAFTPYELLDIVAGQSKVDAVEKLLLIYDKLCEDNESLYKELQEHAETCASLKESVASLVDTLQSGIDELKRLDFEELLETLAEEVFSD